MEGYSERIAGEKYRAETDGFVSAGILPAVDASQFALGTLIGWVEHHVVATTTAGTIGGFSDTWNYLRATTSNSLLMPVPAGVEWHVEWHAHPESQISLPTWVLWLPSGSQSTPSPAAIINRSLPALSVAQKPWENFDPVLINLVTLFENIFDKQLSPTQKEQLVDALKQLI